MNQKDQNFEPVQKLLQLKQHEVPPPGYFNNFSGQVISRLRAGEAARSQSLTERLETEAPWLAGFLSLFETRPGVIGGFATSLCLLLLLTVVFAEHSDSVSGNLLLVAEPSVQVGAAVAPGAASTLMAATDSKGGLMASTNPVTSLQPVATLFGQTASASLFQPASFAPAGR
jgi:hypothetical protein